MQSIHFASNCFRKLSGSRMRSVSLTGNWIGKLFVPEPSSTLNFFPVLWASTTAASTNICGRVHKRSHLTRMSPSRAMR